MEWIATTMLLRVRAMIIGTEYTDTLVVVTKYPPLGGTHSTHSPRGIDPNTPPSIHFLAQYAFKLRALAYSLDGREDASIGTSGWREKLDSAVAAAVVREGTATGSVRERRMRRHGTLPQASLKNMKSLARGNCYPLFVR